MTLIKKKRVTINRVRRGGGILKGKNHTHAKFMKER